MRVIKCLILILFTVPLIGTEGGLQKLIEGNARYVSGHKEPLERVQTPFAVVVACSDSRVAPEIIFDQMLGDLFVVRVAGNVVTDSGMESINYAIDQLHASVVMVLGHKLCGAIEAVRAHMIQDIPKIASLIEPAIKDTTTIEEAVKANVRNVVEKLRSQLTVQVVGGYFDFDTGKVEIL